MFQCSCGELFRKRKVAYLAEIFMENIEQEKMVILETKFEIRILLYDLIYIIP